MSYPVYTCSGYVFGRQGQSYSCASCVSLYLQLIHFFLLCVCILALLLVIGSYNILHSPNVGFAIGMNQDGWYRGSGSFVRIFECSNTARPEILRVKESKREAMP